MMKKCNAILLTLFLLSCMIKTTWSIKIPFVPPFSRRRPEEEEEQSKSLLASSTIPKSKIKTITK